MKLCSIASGSSGNCIYVGTDATHILVDAGISGKRTEAGLETVGLTGKDLDGILITHEHVDHIAGLGVLARKYKLPIYATKRTIQAILHTKSVGVIDPSLFREVEADNVFTVKDMTVYPVKISHDAVEPVAYRLTYGKEKIGIATDLGVYNDYIIENFKGVDILMIEANHDVNMLQVGPYPYQLKRRILGDRGHLSNEMAGRLLDQLLHKDLKAVVLGHLSQDNNIPELAYETVRLELTMGKSGYQVGDFPIQVAKRNSVSEAIVIS